MLAFCILSNDISTANTTSVRSCVRTCAC